MIGVEKNSKGGGVAGSVAFPDIAGDPLDNTALQPYLSSVTNLENNEFKYLYWQSISSSSGTVAIPTGATILLGEIEGLDSLVETISGGKPTGNSPVSSGGSPIVVSSFNSSGNYILSGLPSAFPVAILFVFKIKGKDISNLNLSQIIADEQVGVMIGASAGTDGKSGEVPKPLAGDQNKVLAGNGLFRTIIDLLGYTPQNQDGSTSGSFVSSSRVGAITTFFGSSGLLSTSGVNTTLQTVALTAGNYLVWGYCNFNVNGSVPVTMAFSVARTNFVSLGGEGSVIVHRSSAITVGDQLCSPVTPISISTTTNIFATVFYAFTSGNNGTVAWRMYIQRLP